jgi:ATPase inhibitor, mitochondrial
MERERQEKLKKRLEQEKADSEKVKSADADKVS